MSLRDKTPRVPFCSRFFCPHLFALIPVLKAGQVWRGLESRLQPAERASVPVHINPEINLPGLTGITPSLPRSPALHLPSLPLAEDNQRHTAPWHAHHPKSAALHNPPP